MYAARLKLEVSPAVRVEERIGDRTQPGILITRSVAVLARCRSSAAEKPDLTTIYYFKH